MPVVNTQEDDVYSVNKETPITVIPVHGSSSGAAKDNFLKYLKQAKPGDVVGGDWNVNFAILKNLEAFVQALKEAKLKINITAACVQGLELAYKERDEEELFNSQFLKGGEADVFVKDLAFEVEALNEGEDPIPAALKEKLTRLAQVRTDFLKALNKLKQENENYRPEDVDTLCQPFGIHNFHDPKEFLEEKQQEKVNQSHRYEDHNAVYHFKKTADGREFISYFKNSIAHAAYDLKEQFKDGTDLTDLTPIKDLYHKLGKRDAVEFATLLAKRDGLEAKDLEQKSRRELRKFIAARLEECKYLKNPKTGIELSKDDIQVYFDRMLHWQELKAVNPLLRHSYDLENQEFVDKRLTMLTSEKYMTKYAENIAKIVDVPFKALDIEIPRKGDQSISAQGSGFPPFKKSIEDIEREQIQHMKDDLDVLHKSHPTAEINAHLIEGTDKKGKIVQPQKCKVLEEHVAKLNIESSALRANSVFARKVAVNSAPVAATPDHSITATLR